MNASRRNPDRPALLKTGALAAFSLLMFTPFLVMLLTSLKTPNEIFSSSFVLAPASPQWKNFAEALGRGEWQRYFFNSIFVTLVAVAVSLVINSTAGYAFARLSFKGRHLLFYVSLIGLMIPPQATMIPVFLILMRFPLAGGNDLLGVGGLGLVDSYWGLILPYVAGSFGVFLFRQYYLNFPRALDDAARIDGLGGGKTFFHVYLPLSGPVVATLVTLKATHSWNEYTWPLIITVSEKMRTVQLALTLFREEYQTQWHLLMAATTVIILPLTVLFAASQRYFVAGIATTGIKG
jgi:multiple sugar transport system permease protein